MMLTSINTHPHRSCYRLPGDVVLAKKYGRHLYSAHLIEELVITSESDHAPGRI